MHGNLPIVQLCESEQVLDQFFQAPCLAVCDLYVFVLHVRRYPGIAGQQFQVSDNGGQRSPEIMGHIGDQLILGPLRLPLLIHKSLDIFHHLVQVSCHAGKLIISDHINGGV